MTNTRRIDVAVGSRRGGCCSGFLFGSGCDNFAVDLSVSNTSLVEVSFATGSSDFRFSISLLEFSLYSIGNNTRFGVKVGGDSQPCCWVRMGMRNGT